MGSSRSVSRPLRLGIDASNLRAGGGVTHLAELLASAHPVDHGFSEVVVWGGAETLSRLQKPAWLRAVHVDACERGVFSRLAWQRTRLDRAARDACDVLFVPGGTYLGDFQPFVTVCQNLLPFDRGERRRYGISWVRLRLEVLSRLQASTFRRAAGVIFLTQTAQQTVEAQTGPLEGAKVVIPHGIAARSFREPAAGNQGSAPPARDRSFHWCYVSIVDVYKHQDKVVEAVACLRAAGIRASLELIGPAYGPFLSRVKRVVARVDPRGEFVHYRGAVPYDDLPKSYQRADGFVFASSCETMSNILLEAMASGLPIVCSNRGVMPEVLGDAGILCDPEDVHGITEAMRLMIEDHGMRLRYAERAFKRAMQYSWKHCAAETLTFIASCVGRQRN